MSHYDHQNRFLVHSCSNCGSQLRYECVECAAERADCDVPEDPECSECPGATVYRDELSS